MRSTFNCILAILFFCSFQAFSQVQPGSHYLGVSTSISDNGLWQKQLMGSPGIDDESSSKFGLQYSYQKSKHLGIETGAYLIKHQFTVTPAPTGQPQPSTEHEFQIISIPVNLKYSFFNYFYFNGGLIFDVDVKNSGGTNSQSGAGLGVGIGGQYFYKNAVGFFVNPQISQHSLVSFSGDKYPRTLAEASISFGISVKL